ncbi:MAG: carboxylating nicotinate-nucleotide diphosphorylase [Kiritimatiellae bacterium]|nr:carboxylating nicotinate-nucleotide diphosphorylase [Kiritimatiellia bacterium]
MNLPDLSNDPAVAELVRRAVEEDVGTGDATTEALVSPEAQACGAIIAREACVLAGSPVARLVFQYVEPALGWESRAAEGDAVAPGTTVAVVRGSAGRILIAERTALNFMQRMSGIATLTREFVRRTQPYGADVLDTRKTTPTLRRLEKYAVLCGGGRNHRIGLFDRILIKDNHRRLWRGGTARTLAEAVRAARAARPGLPIEIEVESVDELQDALQANPDWILLDNMPPETMRLCVRAADGRCRLEGSGGITLQNVEEVARTGVNAISLGCLTHSARAVDLSLELE